MTDKSIMFEWTNSYSVGVGSIDAQHKNLFALVRELHAAMSAGQGKAAVGKVLDRLIQYTAVHFAHEERLMRLYDYPDAVAHKAKHDALVRQVVKFQEDYAAGRAAMTVQLLHFLKDWLVTHIQGTDVKLAPCLKDRAVA
jgi:hemerythrin